MLRRALWCLVVCVVFVASCGGTKPFPDDALSVLRSASSRSASSVGAEINGTMNNASGPIVRLAGFVNLRERALTLSTSSALRSNAYLPFESRAIGGWSYVEIDSALLRPPALGKDVNWVAFHGNPGQLPIPAQTLGPTFLFEFFDHLDASQIVGAQYVGGNSDRGSQVRFELPALDNALVTSEYTVMIGADNRIDEITRAFRANGRSQVASDVELTWRTSLPPISAPPSDEVQILTPGQNLFPSTTTTTTIAPPAPGLDESDAIAGNKGLFDAEHAQIETTLGGQSDPKLTEFSFDSTTNTISVAFAYRSPARENRSAYDTFAWGVARNLADTFWSAELVQAVQSQHVEPEWLPRLHLELDQTSYLCPAVVQIAAGAGRISQHDWVVKCAA